MKTISLVFIFIASLLIGARPASAQTQPAPPQVLTAAEVSQREAAVFDALDFSRPELAAVAAAWKQHDQAAAEKALAAFLRGRETVHWGNASDSENAAGVPNRSLVADDAVANKFQGGQVMPIYPFPDGIIDWHDNPTKHLTGYAPDNEWQWQFNRMAFWGELGRAYKETGDERYARAFDHEMLSWVAQSPKPDEALNVPDSDWRTIEAGIRMGGPWEQAFFAFRRSPSVSDTDLIVFVSAFLDHGEYLRKNYTRLNWLTMEMSGLYGVGAMFPEFKQAADWRNLATEKLTAEAQTQFLPDGAQDELSTEYQNVALSNILKIPQIARWTGRSAELPAAYTAPLEKAFEFELSIMAPDRFLPKYNNGLPQYLPSIFKLALENFPGNSGFKWVETDGKQGTAPKFTSIYMNRAGEAAMRSGWGREDNYLGFRLGPIGMAHQHQDKLGVVIWAWGRPIVFNTGGGNYEQSKWRTWATSSYGHNCMIVDGLAQNRPLTSNDPFHNPDLISQGPIDGHWQTSSVFDFASGEYAGDYGPQRVRPASQQRDVMFLKPDIFVVVDRMRPNDSAVHKYQARWQLQTTSTTVDPVTHTLTTTDAGEPNIAIVPLLGDGLDVAAISGQESPELLGWNVRKAMYPQHVPATTLLHTRTGAGPQLLLTLFIPLHAGQANPVASVQAGKDGHSATVTLRDGRKFLVFAAGDRGIRVEETVSAGKKGRAADSGSD